MEHSNNFDHLSCRPGQYDPTNPTHKPRGVALGLKIHVYGNLCVCEREREREKERERERERERDNVTCVCV